MVFHDFGMYAHCKSITDLHRRFKNQSHFPPGKGLQLGVFVSVFVFVFFSLTKIIVICQVPTSPTSAAV